MTRFLASALAILWPLSAWTAQDTAPDTITLPAQTPPPNPEQNATQLAPIIVAGEKLGRALAETTTSVGIVTGEDIASGTSADMHDVVSRFGNVISAKGDREIAIRGIPQDGIGGEGQTLSVYLDGVALPERAASFAGPLSAWDLEQVEVLRGSQSTSQGRNSLAGAVILRSRQPTDYWDLRTRASRFSHDSHDYAIAAGGPIGDTLAFRLTGQDRYDRGDIYNVTRHENDAGREITQNGRAQFRWMPQWDSGYTLNYGYTHAENEFGDPLHDTSQGARTETANVRGNEDVRTRIHSIEQSLQLGNRWDFQTVSGWSRLDNLYVIDFDRTADEGGFSDNTVDDRILSQELRLNFSGDAVNAVIGAYYSDLDRYTSTVGHDVAVAGGLALINGMNQADIDTRTMALFAEADWDFASNWRLTLGGRINQERSRHAAMADLDLTLTASVPGLPLNLPIGVPLGDAVSDALAVALPTFVPPDYNESGGDEFTDFLPKLGLTWFASNSTTLGLQYQEGYRSGGISIAFFGGAVSPYDPEYTRTLELALRQRWLDDRLALNSNVFYTRWRDQQVSIGESSGFNTVTENAGRSHYFGLESELLWRVRGPVEVFASLGLLRTRFDDFVNRTQSSTPGQEDELEDYSGNRFPYAPETTAGLGINLTQWRGFGARISLQYIDDFYSDADNDPRSRSESKTLLHAKLSYAITDKLKLAVYGRNLTDEANDQGTLVSGDDTATRYGEAMSVGGLIEWQL